MSKKQHKGYLTTDERPLFAPVHSMHETAKDKANKRQNKKKQLKKELDEYAK